MSDKLTQKQLTFVLLYFETGNAADAYRRAYDVEPNSRDSWVYVEACQLLDNPKVTQRLKELREQAEKMAVYGVLDASEDYRKAMELAEKIQNPAAMVSAVAGRVRLHGLEAPKRVHQEITGKDGGPIETIDRSMTPAEAAEAYAATLDGDEG